jgi:hypothetical protein
MPGNEDDGYGEPGPSDSSQNLGPGQPGHLHVDHNDVRLEGRQGVEHLDARRERSHLVALAAEEVVQQLQQPRVIVGDQDAGPPSWRHAGLI